MRFEQSVQTKTTRQLLGNWLEESVLREERLKDFREKSQNKELVSSLVDKRLEAGSRQVETSPDLRYSAKIQIACLATNGYLAADLPRAILSNDDVFLISTSSAVKRDARSVFTLEKCPEYKLASEIENSVVRYGEKFYIVSHECSERPLYLCSALKTYSKFAKKSQQQMVYLSPIKNFQSVWSLNYADMDYRVEMESMPVESGRPLIITHCATNNNLFSDSSFIVRNDFGVEYETSCSTKRDLNTKIETAQNHWMLVTDNLS